MIRWYVLEGKTPVLSNEPLVAAAKRSGLGVESNWRVGDTIIGDVRISTVFFGLDHNWMHPEGPPLLFETMVFGGRFNQEQWRCSTWDEAERQHASVVGLVRQQQETHGS